MNLVITLDGPAGAGKSTLARGLAQALGWTYLDTGAMYRAVTWAALDRGLDLTDDAILEALARMLQIVLEPVPEGTRVTVDGHDVTAAIRSSEVTGQVSRVAAVAGVREAMVEQQRRLGQLGPLVAEGRDMGTVVFPEAPLKIFVTASPAVRAARRAEELIRSGRAVDVAVLERELAKRDSLDSSREVAPLRPAEDARTLLTDGRSIAELLDELRAWAGEISVSS
ncbi:MAG: (d)CMP kinase [Candidatus Sericytochromatia bacterium]|nr:(d)CMP kinase [Candidatus Sericytochromatia bacterium]